MAEHGRLVPLSEFSLVLESQRGIERSYRTLYRWAVSGFGRNGKRLACVTIAGVKHTSLELYDQLVGSPDLVTA